MQATKRMAGFARLFFQGWLQAWSRNGLVWCVVGFMSALVAVNINPRPSVEITNMEEAEGPEFSDPGMVDIVSEVHRRQVCPSRAQRFVWRYEMYHGRKAQHAYVLAGTEAPFLADDGTFILSVPAPGIPDPEHGDWKMRTNVVEQCAPMPAWLTRYIGSIFWPTLRPGRDVPVNFVGAPHTSAKP